MAEFNPGQPAVLHEHLNNRLIPWTGKYWADWYEHAERHCEGVINYDGLLFDGWAIEDSPEKQTDKAFI